MGMNGQYSGIVTCAPHCGTKFTSEWIHSMDDDLYQTCHYLTKAICHFPNNKDQCQREQCKHWAKQWEPSQTGLLMLEEPHFSVSKANAYTWFNASSGVELDGVAIDTSGTASQCTVFEGAQIVKGNPFNTSMSILRCTAKMLDDNSKMNFMFASMVIIFVIVVAFAAWYSLPVKFGESPGREPVAPGDSSQDLHTTLLPAQEGCGSSAGVCKSLWAGRHGAVIVLMLSSFVTGMLVTFQIANLNQSRLLRDMSTWLTVQVVEDLSDLDASPSDAQVLQALNTDISTLIGMVAMANR